MAKQEAITADGQVLENLSNDRFKIELNNGFEVTGYPSGKMRQKFIHILPGDKVRVEMSPYDMTTCRIVWRYK